MKRVVYCTVTLGAIITVLGVLASGQAQRGPEPTGASAHLPQLPTTPPTSISDRFGSATSAQPVPNPLRPSDYPSSTATPPRRLPANPYGASGERMVDANVRPVSNNGDPFNGQAGAYPSAAGGAYADSPTELPALAGPGSRQGVSVGGAGAMPVAGPMSSPSAAPHGPPAFMGMPDAGSPAPMRFEQERTASPLAAPPTNEPMGGYPPSDDYEYDPSPRADDAYGLRPVQTDEMSGMIPVGPSMTSSAVRATADGSPLGGTEGVGTPGPQMLEGPQNPQLVLQKLTPDEIQVGKPTTFKLIIRNVGRTTAENVRVVDLIPKGTRLLKTVPLATQNLGDRLTWDLGRLSPADETVIEMHLLPTDEGQIGSVATIQFSADASARTRCTRPQLTVRTTAQREILIGEDLQLTIDVSNPGTGTATGVVVEEHIPAGLQHPSGNALLHEVGDIPPGETRRLQLTLRATRPGQVTNVLSVRGDGSLSAEDHRELTIVAPGLDIDLAGPTRRYLEREATYRLSVNNPGTAPAKGVRLAAFLPSGLKFVHAGAAGTYSEADRAVYWHLEELPVGETGSVELVTMPVEAGEQRIRLHGTAARGVAVEREKPVTVEGISAIMFEAVDVTDPIEVGGGTAYEIRVINQGTKAATGVRLAVLLPPELRALSAEGPSRHVLDANRVVFEPLARIAPKADVTYQVRVQGLRAGDLRTKVQLMTDDMTVPVTKEESTRVFSDR